MGSLEQVNVGDLERSVCHQFSFMDIIFTTAKSGHMRTYPFIGRGEDE